MGIVAEELGFLLTWENMLLREIVFLAGVAQKKRERERPKN